MTTNTKLGKMLERGKIVVMDEDGIAELDNYIVIVHEEGIDHTVIHNSSIGILIKAGIEGAYNNGIKDLALIQYVGDMMGAIYGEDEKE